MRTTLNLDDELVREVKRRAVETGQTMTRIIEDAIRDSLARENSVHEKHVLRWPTVRGRLLPGIDLTDRNALIDRMEGRK